MSSFKKYAFLIIGSIMVIIGFIGIFLPILPTTPFLLLAAWLYAKSSKTFYNWLINNKLLGFYIRSYIEGRGVETKVKVFTLILLWTVILMSAFLFINILWVRIILVVIAVAVSTHIIMLKKMKR